MGQAEWEVVVENQNMVVVELLEIQQLGSLFFGHLEVVVELVRGVLKIQVLLQCIEVECLGILGLEEEYSALHCRLDLDLREQGEAGRGQKTQRFWFVVKTFFALRFLLLILERHQKFLFAPSYRES